MISYKIVAHTLLLGKCRSCRADRYFRKYLPRISINNRYAIILGNIQTCFCLTDTCRTYKDNKSFHSKKIVGFVFSYLMIPRFDDSTKSMIY